MTGLAGFLAFAKTITSGLKGRNADAFLAFGLFGALLIGLYMLPAVSPIWLILAVVVIWAGYVVLGDSKNRSEVRKAEMRTLNEIARGREKIPRFEKRKGLPKGQDDARKPDASEAD